MQMMLDILMDIVALDTSSSEFDNDYKLPEIRVIENTITESG